MRAEFGRVTRLLRELRGIHLNDYYTEYGPAANQPWDGHPWRYSFSSGLQLGPDGSEREDSPLVFTCFDTHDGVRIVRVPFSVASLFEVRAMAAEMKVQLGLLHQLPDDARIVEAASWEEKMKAAVYEPYLAMYSVAAHYLSNVIRTNNEIVSTYSNASVIAGLCLNLPRSLFPKLMVPEAMKPWGARNEAMKARCDRGYLYMSLIENGKDFPLDNVSAWLEQALPASGLPSLVETRELIAADLCRIGGGAMDGPARPRLDDALALGRVFYEQSLSRGELAPQTLDGPTPPVLIQRNRFITFKGGPRHGTFGDPGAWLDRSLGYYDSLKEFVDACVI